VYGRYDDEVGTTCDVELDDHLSCQCQHALTY
jgi:hypothetical protein